MARKPTFSPTRFAAYLECAVKYRYLYIDKIGRFYLKARPGYSFGTTLHGVLQSFHEGGAVQSREEMVVQVEEKWISAGYETPEQEAEFRATGVEIVEAYHTAAEERAALAVETIATEKTIKTDMGPFVLSGRVDRIDQHADGTLEIIDYKSGRMSVSAKEVAESLAMSIYQLILRRIYPGTRVVATIYSLRSGESASSEMSDTDAEVFRTDMLALGEEILAREWEFVKPEPIPACEYCEFISRCKVFWKQRDRRERTDDM